jgi:hypothetical protein
MNDDDLRQQLSVAEAHGVELDEDEREVLEQLRRRRRVEAGGESRRARIAEAAKRERAESERREQAATTTFLGTPPDGPHMVVIGRVHRDRGTLRLSERPNNTFAFHDIVSDHARGEGVYRFAEHSTLHFVRRAIVDALPERIRDRIGFRSSVPDDLWKYVCNGAGIENFLPFNRGTEGKPSAEELSEATAKAIAGCREIVNGCSYRPALSTWLANSSSAGDAAPVLHGVIERRLQELDGSPSPSASGPAPRMQVVSPPENLYTRRRTPPEAA